LIELPALPLVINAPKKRWNLERNSPAQFRSNRNRQHHPYGGLVMDGARYQARRRGSQGVREFREQIARYLESDTPVAVTRRGETLGVCVPTPRKGVKSWILESSRQLPNRLAAALAGMSEEEVAADFKEWRRRKKATAR